MNPFGTRAAADDFARLVDGLPAFAVPGGPPAPAFAVPGGPPAPAFAVPGVALVSRLRAVGAEVDALPRSEFRAALRTRLVAVAGVQAATGSLTGAAASRASASRTAAARAEALAPSWSRSRGAQRRIGFAAGAMASVVAVTGVAVASSRSLPGDPFYGVKRQAEALQLHFANGDVERGTRHLEFAATRLQEVRGLTLGRRVLSLDTGAVPFAGGLAFGGSVEHRVNSTLSAMDHETSVGNALLTTAYRATRSADPLRILTAFANRQSHDLESLLPDLPVSDRLQAQNSLSLVTSVGQQAGVLLSLGSCTAACNPQAAAPTLPTSAPAGPTPDPNATGAPPCLCPPSDVQPSTEPTPAEPSPSETASPTPSPTSSPRPTPSPRPSSSGNPLPVPTPVPLPSLPVPLPTSPPPLPVPVPVSVPSSGSSPTPAPLPLPLLPLVASLLPSVLPHA